jgi:hypothetical protein
VNFGKEGDPKSISLSAKVSLKLKNISNGSAGWKDGRGLVYFK